MLGSSSSHVYGPEFFMAETNVILVTFNYRVGIFGKLIRKTLLMYIVYKVNKVQYIL